MEKENNDVFELPIADVLKYRAKLYDKKNKVMKAIDFLKKEGNNSAQNYKYVEESKVVEAIKLELHKQKLGFHVEIVKHDVLERITTSVYQNKEQKKVSYIVTVVMAFKFVDAETGFEECGQWVGQGFDSTDKGVYKAATGALKYILLKNLLLPTFDDPERANAVDNEETNKQQSGNNNASNKQQNGNKTTTPKAPAAKDILDGLKKAKTLDELETARNKAKGGKYSDAQLSTFKKTYQDMKKKLTPAPKLPEIKAEFFEMLAAVNNSKSLDEALAVKQVVEGLKSKISADEWKDVEASIVDKLKEFEG